jgi:DNA-binding phage protein
MCLLSTAPVIGRRKPSFDSVLKLADAAGLELTLTPKEHRAE